MKIMIWHLSRPMKIFGAPGLYPDMLNYFSGILTEELDDEARPSLSVIAFSDQINDQSLGMQILNELMKIKNGRGGRGFASFRKHFCPLTTP